MVTAHNHCPDASGAQVRPDSEAALGAAPMICAAADPATLGPTFRQRFRTATSGDDRPASQDLRPSKPQSGGPILAS